MPLPSEATALTSTLRPETFELLVGFVIVITGGVASGAEILKFADADFTFAVDASFATVSVRIYDAATAESGALTVKTADFVSAGFSDILIALGDSVKSVGSVGTAVNVDTPHVSESLLVTESVYESELPAVPH